MNRRLAAACLIALTAAASALVRPPAALLAQEPTPRTTAAWTASRGGELYADACAGCHGIDGSGVTQSELGFDLPLADFTDCSFATREPDGDWFAVTHNGGPARGFDRMMPAFGDALTDEEIQAVLDYVRTLCASDDWPRGELNFPRAMFTEKAFVEDEAVWTVAGTVEGPAEITQELVFERRFGARSQFELKIPVTMAERTAGDWTGGVGDLALGLKRVMYHNLQRGTIFSLAGEVIIPTGDEDDGFGSGVLKLEPFASFGQALPADAFIHAQAGAELVTDRTYGDHEGFWRGAIGKSFEQAHFGRTWSPMVEVLGSRAFTSGAPVHWDIAPQFQVTLNTRQHIMANVALRIPLDDAARPKQLLVYLLWDWFDGGLVEGW